MCELGVGEGEQTRNHPLIHFKDKCSSVKGPGDIIINVTKMITCPVISTLGLSYLVKRGLVVSILQNMKLRLGKVRLIPEVKALALVSGGAQTQVPRPAPRPTVGPDASP